MRKSLRFSFLISLIFFTSFAAHGGTFRDFCARSVRTLQLGKYPRSGILRVINRRVDDQGDVILTAHVNNWPLYTIGIGQSRDSHSLWDFIALYPEFSSKLGFKIDIEAQNLQYPETAALNHKMDRLSSSLTKGLPTRFWNPSVLLKQRVSVSNVFDRLRERRAVVASRGHYHFHDIFDHWFYLVMPWELWQWTGGHMEAIVSLGVNPHFQSRKFQRFLDRLSASIVNRIDIFTASAGREFGKVFEFEEFLHGLKTKDPVLAIKRGVKRNIEDLVANMFLSDSFFAHDGIFIPNRAQRMSASENSPQDYWKGILQLLRDTDGDDFGLKKAAIKELEEKIKTFSNVSLTEKRIGTLVWKLFDQFGPPDLASHAKLVSHDEENNGWPRIPPRLQ
ncbi:MAG: hypothetical protein JWQ35_43 [Bacteriovoracaceae bacterium]|nr:hypothetical protein [Bacteriovoracaceae bacterium]